ncbi:MAG: outer membrane protein [Puniceicoccales bacterium]
MKTPLTLFLLSIFLVTLSAQDLNEPMQESFEPMVDEPASRFFASIGIPITFPAGNDWDYSAGVEGRLGVTLVEGLRVYGLLGYSYWYADGDDWLEGFDSVSINGDAGIFSVGGGIEYMVKFNPSHSLSFGANYQYQYVDSDVRYDFSTPFVIESEKFHMDDASALYAGIDYYFNYNANFGFSFGLGYLFNLTSSDVSFQGEHVEDTEFEGFTLRFAVEF